MTSADRPAPRTLRRASVDHRNPLAEQFAAQAARLDLDAHALEAASGYKADTIARYLPLNRAPYRSRHPSGDGGPGRRESRESLPVHFATCLGGVLGFAPAYVAMAQHRDSLRLEEERPGVPVIRQNAFREAREELDRQLAWSHPFEADGKCAREAFRQLRLAHRCSIPQLARDLAQYDGTHSELWYRHRVEQFERGPFTPEPETLGMWLLLINPQGPVRNKLHLNRAGERLRWFHNVSSTMEPFSPRGRSGGGPMQILCPVQPGYAIEFAASPTVFGALGVETITVTQPSPVSDGERGRVRLVSAHHAGFELSVVLCGRVRLTLGRRPFATESLDGPQPSFMAGQDEIVHDGLVEEGDIVTFPSHLYHRAEFLAERNRVISFNVSRNLELARRYPPPARDPHDA